MSDIYTCTAVSSIYTDTDCCDIYAMVKTIEGYLHWHRSVSVIYTGTDLCQIYFSKSLSDIQTGTPQLANIVTNVDILHAIFLDFRILDALASLVLMIVTHSLADWKLMFLYHLSSHHWDCDSRQSIKMECHSKRNVTQNGLSLKMECH